MDKAEFAIQSKSRGEELRELENLVHNYAHKIKGVQAILKGSKIISFREGVIACLQYLDQKAVNAKHKRDLEKAMINDFLGEEKK
jgi:hypothetical protein